MLTARSRCARRLAQTGIYPHNSGHIAGPDWTENEVLANCRTLSEHFRANGYRARGSGKVMHHIIPDLWDEYAHKIDLGPWVYDGKEQVAHPDVPAPFCKIGKIDGSFGPLKVIPYQHDDNPKSGWIEGIWGQANPWRYDGEDDRDPTPDERNAAWAAKRIREHAEADGDQPLFLAVGFARPHTPLHAPQKYFDMYPLDKLQPPLIKEGDADDTWMRDFFWYNQTGWMMYRELMASYDDKEEAIKRFTQAYLACVTAADDCVGQVLDAIDNSSMRDNTIIVFTSDHGWQMGQKEIVFKDAMWDDASRVPFIIRAPGVSQAGTVSTRPVSLIDLYPTLVDLAGLEGDTRKNDKGLPLDGHSVRPFLQDPSTDQWDGPDAALTMVKAKWPSPGIDKHNYSIRTEDWRYIRYGNDAEELYDQTSDPEQWRNLADDPEYAEVKQRLRKKTLDMLGWDRFGVVPKNYPEKGRWLREGPPKMPKGEGKNN